ncbi:unnamed protein product [Didymodactylos carnosus]|uniref:Uncharacterized protein n=1 Tax=Didymodactylos carnosus TaxID=1234261 RepID=A0A813U9M8_9BILA|nr:unnamed protein product [Didymodactylos carnosus]CAF0824606.1 unnamed protein product [Didymodactylos carnosus]CAF3561116.1 unnamed protein product [Didymodactylos carnosus]CAF3611276.1 unnamed protein product [Didymodactylos carnosus]
MNDTRNDQEPISVERTKQENLDTIETTVVEDVVDYYPIVVEYYRIVVLDYFQIVVEARSNSTTMMNGEDPLNRINLQALQNRDPYIIRILDQAQRVCVFKFLPDKQQWERKDIEGTLFVYERNCEPYNGFAIHSTVSMDTFIQILKPAMEFEQRGECFLQYKADVAAYAKERASKKLQQPQQTSKQLPSLVNNHLIDQQSLRQLLPSNDQQKAIDDIPSSASSSSSSSTNGNDRNVDIFKMLVGAQEKFHDYKRQQSVTTPDTPNKVVLLTTTTRTSTTNSGGNSYNPKPVLQKLLSTPSVVTTITENTKTQQTNPFASFHRADTIPTTTAITTSPTPVSSVNQPPTPNSAIPLCLARLFSKDATVTTPNNDELENELKKTLGIPTKPPMSVQDLERQLLNNTTATTMTTSTSNTVVSSYTQNEKFSPASNSLVSSDTVHTISGASDIKDIKPSTISSEGSISTPPLSLSPRFLMSPHHTNSELFENKTLTTANTEWTPSHSRDPPSFESNGGNRLMTPADFVDTNKLLFSAMTLKNTVQQCCRCQTQNIPQISKDHLKQLLVKMLQTDEDFLACLYNAYIEQRKSSSSRVH